MKKIFVSILSLVLLISFMPFNSSTLVSAASNDQLQNITPEHSDVDVGIMLNPGGEFGDNGSNKIRKCIHTKVKNNWKELVGAALISQAINDIMNKKYTAGAKKLIRAGAKGTVVGIAGTLAVFYISCATK